MASPRLRLKNACLNATLSATLSAALGGVPSLWAQPLPDADRLVRDADAYRSGTEPLQVDTEVTVLHADGSTDRQRRYTVYIQRDRRSLVLMRSAAEQGQKVLMLGDDFWLLLPGTQRPMRITAAQKLLGDASTGDIATLRWSEDYRGSLVAAEPCDASPGAAPTCWHLSLAAQRRGVSYQRIELWIGQQHHEPVRAELYLQSDKLAKQALFELDRPTGQPGAQVTAMRLADQLTGRKTTVVRYLARTPRTVPETWLNPMFLARSPSLE